MSRSLRAISAPRHTPRTALMLTFTALLLAVPTSAIHADAPQLPACDTVDEEPELYTTASLDFGPPIEYQGGTCVDQDDDGEDDVCCWDAGGDGTLDGCCHSLRWHRGANFNSKVYTHLAIGHLAGGDFTVDHCKPVAEACWGPQSDPTYCDGFAYCVTPNWRERRTQLWAVSDCTDNPFRRRLVAELTSYFPAPVGTISADTPLCVRKEVPPEDNYCSSGITVNSEHIPGIDPAVFVYVHDDEAGPERWPWKCGPANTDLSFDGSDVRIEDDDGVTFELWSVPGMDCEPPYPSYADLPALGASPLDEVTVTSVQPRTPVCPVDHQPMAASAIGVVTNGLQYTCGLWCINTHGTNSRACRQGCYGTVAQKLQAIGVSYHRMTIRWDDGLQPARDGDLMWDSVDPINAVYDYDAILTAFALEGIEPWLTFDMTPSWASSIPNFSLTLYENCNSRDHDYYEYPPKSEDLDYWDNYVSQVVQRYGEGPGSILSSLAPARNFEVWQEPNNRAFFKIDPIQSGCDHPVCDETTQFEGCNSDDSARYAKWSELQRRTYGIVNPLGLTLWSGNLVYTFQSPANEFYAPWVEPQLETLADDPMFHGLNMHAFHREYLASSPAVQADNEITSTIDTTYQMVGHARSTLDAAGHAATEIALTVADWHPLEQWDPWSFERELPNADDRGEFLRRTFACMANAGADYVFWFNAMDYTWGCVDGEPQPDHDPGNGPDVGWRLGLLDENLDETELYYAFGDVCNHLTTCVPSLD